jgi:hypothetical protein
VANGGATVGKAGGAASLNMYSPSAVQAAVNVANNEYGAALMAQASSSPFLAAAAALLQQQQKQTIAMLVAAAQAQQAQAAPSGVQNAAAASLVPSLNLAWPFSVSIGGANTGLKRKASFDQDSELVGFSLISAFSPPPFFSPWSLYCLVKMSQSCILTARKVKPYSGQAFSRLVPDEVIYK